jgi:hypothetical protein
MTELSPSAQAVLNAFRAVPDLRDCPSIAAALRAASKFVSAIEVEAGDELLAIAAELEAHQ